MRSAFRLTIIWSGIRPSSAVVCARALPSRQLEGNAAGVRSDGEKDCGRCITNW